MRTKVTTPVLVLLAAAALGGQTPAWQDPERAIVVRAADESGLAVVSRDCAATEIRPRGGVAVIDLSCRVELRNESRKALRGAALAVKSLGAGAGGRAAVFAPSLNVAPGASFPVNVRVRLLSPAGAVAGGDPLAEIAVDGALFADMAYAGPDTIESRRKLTRYEAEARVDRERLRALLAAEGGEALRAEMLSTIEREGRNPTLEARLAGQGAAVSAGATDRANRQALAMVRLPDAPVELVAGSSGVESDAVSGLTLAVKNVSGRAVRALDVAWLVRDAEGRRHAVGVVPFEPGAIAPGADAELDWDRRYELSGPGGAAFAPAGAEAYVRRVELGDGSVWTPSRRALAEAELLDLEGVTAEEQRLTALYRREGLQALISELNRF